MSKKPLSPLRQRLIDDMTARRFRARCRPRSRPYDRRSTASSPEPGGGPQEGLSYRRGDRSRLPDRRSAASRLSLVLDPALAKRA